MTSCGTVNHWATQGSALVLGSSSVTVFTDLRESLLEEKVPVARCLAPELLPRVKLAMVSVMREI